MTSKIGRYTPARVAAKVSSFIAVRWIRRFWTDVAQSKTIADTEALPSSHGGLTPLEVFAIGFLKVGGADGIRIRQLYGNKGVLRCSLAF
jgi:hypothetical protein